MGRTQIKNWIVTRSGATMTVVGINASAPPGGFVGVRITRVVEIKGPHEGSPLTLAITEGGDEFELI